MLSLLGMVLAIMVVDDAIVVVENVERQSKRPAAAQSRAGSDGQ